MADKYMIVASEADMVEVNHRVWLDLTAIPPSSPRQTRYAWSYQVHPATGEYAIRVPEQYANESGILTQEEIDSLVDELPAGWEEGVV